jgi:hypothetical protein
LGGWAAPPFMKVIMGLARAMLNARTLERFLVLGDSYQTELLQHVGAGTLQHLASMAGHQAAVADTGAPGSGQDTYPHVSQPRRAPRLVSRPELWRTWQGAGCRGAARGGGPGVGTGGVDGGVGQHARGWGGGPVRGQTDQRRGCPAARHAANAGSGWATGDGAVHRGGAGAAQLGLGQQGELDPHQASALHGPAAKAADRAHAPGPANKLSSDGL